MVGKTRPNNLGNCYSAYIHASHFNEVGLYHRREIAHDIVSKKINKTNQTKML